MSESEHNAVGRVLARTRVRARRAGGPRAPTDSPFDMMIATITPKIPSAEPKISTIKILTNRLGSCASASAQLEPATPTPAGRVGQREVSLGECAVRPRSLCACARAAARAFFACARSHVPRTRARARAARRQDTHKYRCRGSSARRRGRSRASRTRQSARRAGSWPERTGPSACRSAEARSCWRAGWRGSRRRSPSPRRRSPVWKRGRGECVVALACMQGQARGYAHAGSSCARATWLASSVRPYDTRMTPAARAAQRLHGDRYHAHQPATCRIHGNIRGVSGARVPRRGDGRQLGCSHGGSLARARARPRKAGAHSTSARAQQDAASLTEIRFLLRMRGALTDAPRMLEPVMKMPQAAPITHRKSALDVPTAAIEKGLRGAAGVSGARRVAQRAAEPHALYVRQHVRPVRVVQARAGRRHRGRVGGQREAVQGATRNLPGQDRGDERRYESRSGHAKRATTE